MSFLRPDDRTTIDDLVDELVQAHLDTIEIGGGVASARDWGEHVLYLQQLVRFAKRATASQADDADGL